MNLRHRDPLVQFRIASRNHGHMPHLPAGPCLLFAVEVKKGARYVQHILKAFDLRRSSATFSQIYTRVRLFDDICISQR